MFISQEVDDTPAAQLSNLYQDYMKNHLIPKLREYEGLEKIGPLKTILNKVENKFLPNIVAQSFVLSATNSDSGVRELSLELLPNVVSPFRGCLGNDCSIISAPHFGLHEDVQVFLDS